jgi:hypothetical protein
MIPPPLPMARPSGQRTSLCRTPPRHSNPDRSGSTRVPSKKALGSGARCAGRPLLAAPKLAPHSASTNWAHSESPGAEQSDNDCSTALLRRGARACAGVSARHGVLTRQAHLFRASFTRCSSGASTYSVCRSRPVASSVARGLRCRKPRRSISSTSSLWRAYNAARRPSQRLVSGWREYPLPPFVRIDHIACSSRCSPSRC